MKKTLIIIVNVVIMAAILIFVVLYSRSESKAAYQRQIEYFEDSVRVSCSQKKLRRCNVKTMPYPGFPTDS